MIALIRRLFTTPDGFQNQPRKYALNQIGHVALGALTAWALGLWWALVVWAVWEAAQYLLAGGEDWDCAEDFGFEASGALALSNPLILLPAAAFLLSGVRSRS